MTKTSEERQEQVSEQTRKEEADVERTPKANSELQLL